MNRVRSRFGIFTRITRERERQGAEDESRKAREFKIAQRAQSFERTTRLLGIVGFLAILATGIALSSAVNANMQVQSAAQTLTPIPVTLTEVAQQINDGNMRLESLRLASGAITTLQTDTGNAETARDFVFAQHGICSQPQSQALGQNLRLFNARFRHQDDEFVAAITCHHIGLPAFVLEQPPHAREHQVTFEVTRGVIHFFELIKID